MIQIKVLLKGKSVNKMKKFIYLAVFAISFSVLVFETILLKFFTYKMISSWAFLIVSIAFLGIGASGTYLYLKRDETLQKPNFLFLSNFSTLYTLSIPLSIMLFVWFPFSPPQHLLLQNAIFSLFYMFLFAIPFFLSGICITYILSLKEFHVGRVLFFDLIGAGLGSISCILLLRILGAYGVLILSISSAYLSAMIFSSLSAKAHTKSALKVKIFLPIVLCFALLVYPYIMVHFYQFDIVSTNRDEQQFKIFKDDFHGIEATYWNPITRIDLSKEGESNRYLYLYGLAKKYHNKKYTGRYILLDSGAATRQFRFDGDRTTKEFFGHFLFSIPYRLMNNVKDALIIGPGGGLEILIGKYFKVNHIDAVDINSDIIDILTGRNKNDKMSDIYSRFTLSDNETLVRYYTQEGRSFLSRDAVSKYDIVQLTGVDLLSALMSGGMILSESYLYTQEALGYYYNALRENGYMQICYWGGPYALRLFITSLEMLSSKGVYDPGQSLVVVDDGQGFTELIIKKGIFSNRETMEIKKICEEDGFGILFMPESGENIRGEIHYFLAFRPESRKMLIKSLSYNVRPTHDDKPFFYAIYNANFWALGLSHNETALVLTFIGTFLAFIFILLPLIVKQLKSKPTEKIPFKFLPFFGIVGLAFSLIEVVILQKFAIFVGGPFYTMGVTLPAILIFYSIGAFSTAKIKLSTTRLLAISTIGIVLYGILGYLFLDKTIKNLFYLSHLGRVILTIILVSPLAFFIGFPTPVVLEAIKNKIDRNIVSWMWGVNSCGNVIGALLFAPISQMIGFNLLLLISCCLYLIALLFLRRINSDIAINDNLS